MLAEVHTWRKLFQKRVEKILNSDVNSNNFESTEKNKLKKIGSDPSSQFQKCVQLFTNIVNYHKYIQQQFLSSVEAFTF